MKKLFVTVLSLGLLACGMHSECMDAEIKTRKREFGEAFRLYESEKERYCDHLCINNQWAYENEKTSEIKNKEERSKKEADIFKRIAAEESMEYFRKKIKRLEEEAENKRKLYNDAVEKQKVIREMIERVKNTVSEKNADIDMVILIEEEKEMAGLERL